MFRIKMIRSPIMRYLCALLIIAATYGFLPTVMAEGGSCAVALSTAIPSSWANEDIAEARLMAVVQHQNEIRRSLDLPSLSLSHEQSAYGLRLNSKEFTKDFFVNMDGFPDETIMGKFDIQGDSVVRQMYNDIFSLNYKYEFSGSKISRATPLAVALLEKVKGPFIELYRQMSPIEWDLWKNRQLTSLGRNWGHQDSEKNPIKVV